MKNSIVFIFLMLFFSCKKEEFIETTKHQNGKCILTIKGEKSSALSSWNVNIKVNAHMMEDGHLFFEIYSKKLDSSISYTWKDNENCIISFKQDDGISRNFHLISTEKQLYLGEVK